VLPKKQLQGDVAASRSSFSTELLKTVAYSKKDVQKSAEKTFLTFAGGAYLSMVSNCNRIITYVKEHMKRVFLGNAWKH
jgi:hypothetical protein